MKAIAPATMLNGNFINCAYVGTVPVITENNIVVCKLEEVPEMQRTISKYKGNERQTMRVKFRDVPLGGRIGINETVWVVLERHGRGKIARECLDLGNSPAQCAKL